MHTLETIHISKNIKNNQILNDINIYLKSEKIYGLIGQNGSGKTMLFRILSGLVKPSTGKVILDGTETYTLSGVFFTYLNLSRDYMEYIDYPIENINYSDLRQMEFFAGSKRMVEELNHIKHMIINKYGRVDLPLTR